MLSNEEADWVRLTLQTNGWQRVMMPRIAQRGKEALRQLVLFPGERQQGFDDNKLRAIISEAEWLLTAFENEVKMNLEERRKEEALRQERALSQPDSNNQGETPVSP